MNLRCVLALALAAFPAITSAEETGQRKGEKTVLYLQAGYSSSPWHMGGAALGGAFVRDLTSRLSAEAQASYLARGMGSNAFNASASLLVNLRPRGEKAVPYLAAGGGVYRASFDMGSDRFSGPMDMSGSMACCSGAMGMTWPGAEQWDYGQMPHFYGARMAGQEGSYPGPRTFTDPVVSLGAGIRIDVGSHLDLRPELRALVVVSGGDTSTSGLFTVNLGYRF